MFFAFGVLLLLGGVAMLVIGGFTLPNGRTVADRPARRLGGVFVSYLPVLIVIGIILRWILGEGVIDNTIVFAILTLAYLIATVILFLRSLTPVARKPSGTVSASAANPFADAGGAEPPKTQTNPFDFT